MSLAEAGRKRPSYVESTATIMGGVEVTWAMNVGIAVVIDNEGDVLIKVEVCDRKKRG